MKTNTTKTISPDKQKAFRLSKQAHGTITKVLTMIEEDAYCPEILQQVNSVIGMLRVAEKELLANHLEHCVARRFSENKDKTIKELLKIYDLSS